MGGSVDIRLVCVLLAAAGAAGCKPKQPPSPAKAPPSAYFQTPFQTESEFIVGAIASDLAEQIYYASSHQMPDKSHFQVTATEKPGSPRDTPGFDLQIRLDPKQRDLKSAVNISGPIWSPAVYDSLASELARAVGLSSGSSNKSEETGLLEELTDGTPETIEEQNQQLSAALEKDFRNPELHEKAAALLGAFLLRDHSGHFYEIRSPLCRMTAHLAMARFLRGGDSYSVSGRMAEAMLLSLIGAQAQALQRLDGFGTNDASVVAWTRALRARDTGDYRPLARAKERTRIESVEWFVASADYAGAPMTWVKLSEQEKRTADFVRAANQEAYSVEMGHELLSASLPLELAEAKSIYELWHHAKLSGVVPTKALNELPERCFSGGADGRVGVRVIGWGQWATFLQRHLCDAVQQNFYFMDSKWGVHDDAKEFAKQCEKEFNGLYLYPFVRRFNCSDEAAYHHAVDDGLKVTIATPHLVPASCWNYLCYKVRFAPLYQPNPNPHLNEWHNHNPPPGTVYDLNPRLDHPSLVGRPDAVPYFEGLHQLAPFDCRIVSFLLKRKYQDHPTTDQTTALYSNVLPYTVFALRAVARTAYDKPEQYEKLMLQAAELEPSCYYDLGDYALTRKQEDKGAGYLDKACAADPDAVRIASHAEWRVRYYLKKGKVDKAREIADEAGEVYSFRGLEAKAVFLEATTNYNEAFDWFAKIEERYDNSSPLLDFCQRYKAQTGDQRFQPEVQKRIGKLFPKGMEQVSLKGFQGPPADGVLIQQENDLLRAAGLKTGDVIVAVYGVRVHNLKQYLYGRDLKNTAELDLIVWQGGAYKELKPSPPQHRFGVNFGDYPSK